MGFAVALMNRVDHLTASRKTCGGQLLTDHPPFGLVDVYAATIPTCRHQPTLHVPYQETVLRISDGLPKMKDMPKEMGGSGELLPE